MLNNLVTIFDAFFFQISRSDKSTVFLRNLSSESYGNYTCQVSTDKPFFRCVQTTKPLEVVGK